ncbi:HflC protein [hydrothermal vent metagenome]|uniref:HflC protein n=1 Tax=hydrothermal vent metagenome TaxID=652676 RepID=A0A3B1AXN4_9ZZZZ
MTAKIWSMFIILAVVLILAANSFYTVDERVFAVKFALGKFSDSKIDSGLHIKLPFVNNVKKFDKRIQTYDVRPQFFTTADSEILNVDYYIKWKIYNIEDFYIKNTTGINAINKEAEGRLFAIVNQALLDVFAKKSKRQVVSTEREQIMQQVTKEMNLLSTGLISEQEDFVLKGNEDPGFGVEIIDVRIKRIELPEDILRKTFDRMKSDREKVARQYRAEGVSEANKIQAKADKDKVIIIANAQRDGQIIRGEGDAKAAKIFATAYKLNSEFYAFYRSLESYKKSFVDGNDFIVLEPNSDFFSYFKNQKPKNK